MPTDDPLMARIDAALADQATWTPPDGFAMRTAVVPEPAEPERGPGWLSVLASGAGMSLIALVAGLAIGKVSEAFTARATNALVMNPVSVAWWCLVLLVVTALLFPSAWSPESDSQ